MVAFLWGFISKIKIAFLKKVFQEIKMHFYICMYSHEYPSSALGADDQENNPEVGPTFRTLPERPEIPVSDAPRIERTTLKMQTKVPTQTKVCAEGGCRRSAVLNCSIII